MAKDIIREDIMKALELSRQPQSENLKIYVGSMVLFNEVLMKIEAKEGKVQEGNPFTTYHNAQILQNSQLYRNHYIAFKGVKVIAGGKILTDQDYTEWKARQ